MIAEKRQLFFSLFLHWNQATLHGSFSITRFEADTIHCEPEAEDTATVVAVATMQQNRLPEVAVFWVAALRLLVLAFPFFTALSPGPKEAAL